MVHPDSNGVSRVPPYLGNPKGDRSVFAYRAVTSYGALFQGALANRRFFNSPEDPPTLLSVPTTPLLQRRRAVTQHRFRLFPFRSPLLRESRLLYFPEGTEMFQFPSLALHNYVFIMQYPGMTRDGLSHSEIRGSKGVCPSPRLIAAYHVLHRLRVPRHPPHALSNLTEKHGKFASFQMYKFTGFSTCRLASFSTFKLSKLISDHGR